MISQSFIFLLGSYFHLSPIHSCQAEPPRLIGFSFLSFIWKLIIVFVENTPEHLLPFNDIFLRYIFTPENLIMQGKIFKISISMHIIASFNSIFFVQRVSVICTAKAIPEEINELLCVLSRTIRFISKRKKSFVWNSTLATLNVFSGNASTILVTTAEIEADLVFLNKKRSQLSNTFESAFLKFSRKNFSNAI